MDAEIIKGLIELADKITTFGALLIWITWLIKENAQLKTLVYSDWQRQRDEEIDRRAEERFQKKLTTIPLGGQGV